MESFRSSVSSTFPSAFLKPVWEVATPSTACWQSSELTEDVPYSQVHSRTRTSPTLREM